MKLGVLLLAIGCSGTPVPTVADPPEYEESGGPSEHVEFVAAPLAAFGMLGAKSCGAAAFGPRLLLTAAHCVRGEVGDAGPDYVDGETWVGAAGGSVLGVDTTILELDAESDRAVLETADDLPAWTYARKPVDGEPVRVVIQETGPTRFESYEDVVTDGTLLPSIAFAKGDSGSPVYGADGEIVGVMITCEGADGACFEVGGRFAPAE